MSDLHFAKRHGFNRISAGMALVVTLLALGTLPLLAADEPSLAEPANQFTVRPHEGAEELLTAGVALHEDAARATALYVEKINAEQAKSIKPLEVGKTYVKTMQGMRAAMRLNLLAEVAGADLEFRLAEVQQQLFGVMEAYKRTPEGARAIGQALVKLQAETEKRMKSLPRIDKLIAEEKWEEAERELQEIVVALSPVGVWFEPQQRPYNVFVERLRSVDEALVPKRQASAVAAVTAARDEAKPDFEALLLELADSKSKVGNAGPLDQNGDAADGPALIAIFGAKWRQVQLAAALCQALGWALKSIDPKSVDTAAFIDAQHQAHADAIDGIAELVEADAATLDAAGAEELHPRYVNELAIVASRLPGDEARKRFQLALDKLAAKSPVLSADVAAYKTATAEILRWRRRAAAAQATRRQTEYPPVERQVRILSGQQGSTFGLVLSGGTESTLGVDFNRSAPGIVAAMAAGVLEQQVTVTDVARWSTDSPGGVSSCEGFVYVDVPEVEVQSAAADSLAADLLAGEDAPPLTLDAAVAWLTARQGSAAEMGGRIEGLTLEASIPRIAGLSDSDGGLARLQPLEKLAAEERMGRRFLLRLTLRPEWVRHDCYFVLLPSGE